jgi:hypothetical protein
MWALEAGPTGFSLHDDLVAGGYPCLVVPPSMVPTAPGQRVKTNRLDSRSDETENCVNLTLCSVSVPLLHESLDLLLISFHVNASYLSPRMRYRKISTLF